MGVVGGSGRCGWRTIGGLVGGPSGCCRGVGGESYVKVCSQLLPVMNEQTIMEGMSIS